MKYIGLIRCTQLPYEIFGLRKRSIIETINDQLKNISNIEHSRHRSTTNFVVNWLGALIAYTHQPKKPRITGIPDKFLITWS